MLVQIVVEHEVCSMPHEVRRRVWRRLPQQVRRIGEEVEIPRKLLLMPRGCHRGPRVP